MHRKWRLSIFWVKELEGNLVIQFLILKMRGGSFVGKFGKIHQPPEGIIFSPVKHSHLASELPVLYSEPWLAFWWLTWTECHSEPDKGLFVIFNTCLVLNTRPAHLRLEAFHFFFFFKPQCWLVTLITATTLDTPIQCHQWWRKSSIYSVSSYLLAFSLFLFLFCFIAD